MREQNQIGLHRFDDLLEGQRKTVGSVFVEQVVFDEQDFVELVGGELVGERGDSFADDDTGERAFGVLDDLLGSGESLEADASPLPFALLGDE